MSIEYIYNSCPIVVQNITVSLMGAWLKKKRYCGDFKKILCQLRASRYMEKSVHDQMTLHNLKGMLRYCNENIPYYSKIFKTNKFNVDKVNSLKDLERIPILDKDTFKKEYESFLPKDIQKKKFMLQKTSGSTGTPLSIVVDQYTYRMAMALLVEHEAHHGIRRGDRRATFAGRMVQKIDNNNPPFWRFNIAENQMIFSAYHINSQNIFTYIDKLNKFKPLEIIGYPSAIYSLARIGQKNNCSVKFKPKAIVTNSETLYEWQRKAIEAFFDCKIYDYYGSAEYVVFAAQCRESNYHINPAIGILEIVDPKEKSVVGETGEMVCTSLTNFANPLIRYKIGDSGMLSEERCDCQCNFKILRSIEGRTDDQLISLDGKRIGRLDHVFKGIESIKECQIIQTASGKIHLKVVKDVGFTNNDQKNLLENLKKRVGYNMAVSFEYVTEIERTSRGKFKGVVNNMKNSF